MGSTYNQTVRWFTYEPGDPREEQRREELERLIDSWWVAFEETTDALEAHFKRRERWDLPGWMQQHLQAIHPGLMWEFGPGLESGHRLVITPEVHTHLRPLVTRILEHAPAIEGWQFFGYRLPEKFDHLGPAIEARTGNRWVGTRVQCTAGSSNQIDITFRFPKKALKRDENLCFSQAFVACETLLGEEALDDWVGAIEVAAGRGSGIVVELFRSEFEKTRSAICERRLPPTPVHQLTGDTEWTLYKLEPQAAEDYPRQLDLFVARTPLTEMWRTGHSDVSFSSCRFSRFGEQFCYLKLDGSEGLDEERFADKAEIEDAIDDVLRPGGLGCVIGGGTGLRYSYIDLALTDLAAAVPVLRSLLRNGRVPLRSWIQFYDTAWQREWIGIWAESPPPPMIEVADA